MKIKAPQLNKTILILILVLISCSKEKEETLSSEPEEKLTSEELVFLQNIAKVDKDMNQFWEGFNSVRKTPIFILTQPDNGILLNPPAIEISNSRLIPNELGMGLENFKAYRNDQILDHALVELNSPDESSLFSFVFNPSHKIMYYNLTYDLTGSFYNEYKNRNGYFHPSVFFHELFHCYHFENHEAFEGDYRNQNLFEYPINENTLPLLILLYDVMIDAYHAQDTDQKQKILSYYVSIQDKLLQLDTTDEKFIRHHGFYQEKSEGIARYIEVYSTLYSLNNNTLEDPTHGYKEFAETITESIQVYQVYGWRIFYHSGAGVIHLLKELGYPNLERDIFIPENTPFDLAKSLLNLTDSELKNALENAKTEYNWDSLVERSNYLLSLKD